METKFTKGEWLSRELVVYNSETGQTIAHIGKWAVKTEEEAEANAKLIAAAPEMLETLIEIREWYEKNHNKLLGELTPICFSKALSAILKATE